MLARARYAPLLPSFMYLFIYLFIILQKVDPLEICMAKIGKHLLNCDFMQCIDF